MYYGKRGRQATAPGGQTVRDVHLGLGRLLLARGVGLVHCAVERRLLEDTAAASGSLVFRAQNYPPCADKLDTQHGSESL
jgi:hypothetical protein